MKTLFCNIYTQFYGEPMSEPKQATHNKITGDELQEFCEFYFDERLNKSYLNHFNLVDKSDITITKIIYFMIGFVLSGLFTYLIFF